MSHSDGFRVVSRSVAWELLCFELYGENSLPTAKTKEVASNAFKASVLLSNSLATIQYGLILPLKERTVGLTNDQAVYLEVYRDHTALCSAIEKVQGVYKSYVTDQEDLAKAPTRERAAARNREFATGNELVKKYDDLIQLAIVQADKIGMNKAAYFAGFHEELDGKTLGHIYNTVNMIRAKAGIEKSTRKDNSPDVLKSEYLKFATEFVSNVREARLKSGNSSALDLSEGIYAPITNAFINGLAAIPELESDEGLMLIELYGELTEQQTPESITETQNAAIQSFQDKIEVLLSQEQEITTADLQNIQYKGISLLSVIPPSSIDRLNELKNLKSDLENIQSKIQRTEEVIVEGRQFIARPVEYSFNDVQTFLDELSLEAHLGLSLLSLEELNDLAPIKPGREGKKLEDLPKDDTALGRLATSYTEALERHAALTQQITEITENQAQAKTVRTQAITDNKAEVAVVKEEVLRLNRALGTERDTLRAKQEELETLEKAIAAEIKILAGEEKGSNKIQKNLKEIKMAGFKRDSDALLQPLQEEVDNLQDNFNATFAAWNIQHESLTRLQTVQTELIEADGIQDAADALLLQGLNEQLEDVNARKVAELSGDDIKALAIHLGIDGKAVSQNSLAKQLNGVNVAEARVKRLTDDVSQLKNEAEDMTNEVLALNLANMFGDEEKAEIANQLQSNLVIAKQVTMKVGQEIVKLQDKASQAVLDVAIAKDLPHMLVQRASVSRESGLQRKLMSLEVQDGNADNLHDLVNKRLENVKMVVEVRQRQAAREDDSSDVEEFFSFSCEESNSDLNGLVVSKADAALTSASNDSKAQVLEISTDEEV
jgi:hypothetical protein